MNKVKASMRFLPRHPVHCQKPLSESERHFLAADQKGVHLEAQVQVELIPSGYNGYFCQHLHLGLDD